MIPALIVGGIVLNGIYGVEQSSKIDAQTIKKNAKAFATSAYAEIRVEKAKVEMEQSILRFANRKKGIIIGYIQPFQEIYKKLIEIKFEKDIIPENFSLQMKNYAIATKTISVNFGNIHSKQLSDRECLVGLVAYGLSGMMTKMSEMEMSAARSRVRQSRVVEAHADTICMTLNAIQTKVDMMSKVLASIGMLFNKSLIYTKSLIEKNGAYSFRYSKEEKEALGICVELAQLLYAILDTPLFDENGEIEQVALDAIQAGEQYVKKLNNVE